MGASRINAIAKKYGFTTYLEIGVFKGETFLNVDMPHKTAVDPSFLFDTKKHNAPGVIFCEMPSDDFFRFLPEIAKTPAYSIAGREKFSFDFVYIDGLHTFEQSYRDFLNSLAWTHENTIWIFDDTVPSDPWSAIPDREKSIAYRELAYIDDDPWHGDVFKTIFAIHDLHPEFSWATQINVGNPQTILWRTKEPSQREPIFGNIEAIKQMSYFDMLDLHHILCPMDDMMAQVMIGNKVDPTRFKDVNNLRHLVKPITSRLQRVYKK